MESVRIIRLLVVSNLCLTLCCAVLGGTLAFLLSRPGSDSGPSSLAGTSSVSAPVRTEAVPLVEATEQAMPAPSGSAPASRAVAAVPATAPAIASVQTPIRPTSTATAQTASARQQAVQTVRSPNIPQQVPPSTGTSASAAAPGTGSVATSAATTPSVTAFATGGGAAFATAPTGASPGQIAVDPVSGLGVRRDPASGIAEVSIPEGTISVPASIEETSPELNLTPEQEREKQRLARDFVEDVENGSTSGDGRPNNFTDNPQVRNDEMFRILFGHDKFLAQQRRSLAQSSESGNAEE